uniref:Uncharacterized protein n=1 Tax=Anguilla anguilla TaxID=7936 RepID=A0A0E9VG50_ANGAN
MNQILQDIRFQLYHWPVIIPLLLSVY